MSKSVKSSQSKRSAPSTAAERKPALSIIKDIQRQTRRQYTAEEKIRIVLEGLQGEQSVAEICRREGLNRTDFYGLSKGWCIIFVIFFAPAHNGTHPVNQLVTGGINNQHFGLTFLDLANVVVLKVSR